jgi:hypothetical protein
MLKIFSIEKCHFQSSDQSFDLLIISHHNNNVKLHIINYFSIFKYIITPTNDLNIHNSCKIYLWKKLYITTK